MIWTYFCCDPEAALHAQMVADNERSLRQWELEQDLSYLPQEEVVIEPEIICAAVVDWVLGEMDDVRAETEDCNAEWSRTDEVCSAADQG